MGRCRPRVAAPSAASGGRTRTLGRPGRQGCSMTANATSTVGHSEVSPGADATARMAVADARSDEEVMELAYRLLTFTPSRVTDVTEASELLPNDPEDPAVRQLVGSLVRAGQPGLAWGAMRVLRAV